MLQIDSARLRSALETDGEFRRASRAWTGSFGFSDGEGFLSITLVNGNVDAASTGHGSGRADVVFTGPAEGWKHIFSAVPPPYYQDLLGGACGHHGFAPMGDLVTMAAYYGAIQRAAVLAGRVLRGEA